MKTLRRMLVGSTLAVLACGLASAGTMSVTCSTIYDQTELNSSDTVSCADFAGIAGQSLTGITITINGSLIGPGFTSTNGTITALPGSSITISNTDSATHTASATIDSGFSLAGSLSGFSFSCGGVCINGTLFDVFAGTGLQTLAANSSNPFSVTGSGSASGSDSNTGTFGSYTGAGSFTLAATTQTGLNTLGGGGNVTFAQLTDASLTATVVYTYGPTVAPEPGTLFLMGSALVAAGLIRKRIKS